MDRLRAFVHNHGGFVVRFLLLNCIVLFFVFHLLSSLFVFLFLSLCICVFVCVCAFVHMCVCAPYVLRVLFMFVYTYVDVSSFLDVGACLDAGVPVAAAPVTQDPRVEFRETAEKGGGLFTRGLIPAQSCVGTSLSFEVKWRTRTQRVSLLQPSWCQSPPHVFSMGEKLRKFLSSKKSS